MPSVHYGQKVIPRYLPSKIFRPIGSLRNLIFRLRFFPENGLRSETGVLHRETIHIGDVELMYIKKQVKLRHSGASTLGRK